jgi:hypothetical protein
MITENQLSGGSALRIPELEQVANLWKKRNRRQMINGNQMIGDKWDPEQYRKLKAKYRGTPFIGFISVLLFYLMAAFFFYLCVRLMDAFGVINVIQEIVMALLGISVGLIGFFLFKKSFLKVA